MKNVINEKSKIGDIVIIFPGASDIFYRHHIDFCCGGNRPLEEAIEKQGLDGKHLIEEINSKYEVFSSQTDQFMDWAKESPSKLIEHIIGTHHAYLREELPRLSEYLFKILKVHGKGHEELFEVHKLYNTLRTELEGHLVKEEEYLFPMLNKLEKDPSLKGAMEKLREEIEQEHTGAGDILKELREVTDHYKIPEDACKTYEITYEKLKELESDLFIHIHLENNILFSRA